MLPCNYSEQGIWVGDKSQGTYYNFFQDKNMDSGRKKWFDLLQISGFWMYIQVILI